MNKLFSKVAALSVGLAMAIGVGVAVGSKGVKEARATEPDTTKYQKITAVSGLAAGDKAVLYNPTDSEGVTGTSGTKDASAAASGWLEYTVAKTTNGFTLQAGTNSYVTLGTKSFSHTADATDLSVTSNGYLCTVANADNILYRQSTYIRTYTGKSEDETYHPFAVYKVLNSTPVQSFTIAYDKNGGSGSMDNSTNTVSQCGFTAPSGKKFSKWNTAANGSGTDYAPGATAPSDLDLYAIWVDDLGTEYVLEAKALGLSSNVGDGSEVVSGVTFVYGQAKSQTVSGTNAFSTEAAILLNADTGYLYNSDALSGEISKFEIFVNSGASTKAAVDVSFSTSALTEAKETADFSKTLDTTNTIVEPDSIPASMKYFRIDSVGSNSKACQIQVRITTVQSVDPSKKNMVIYLGENTADGSTVLWSNSTGIYGFTAKEESTPVTDISWSVSDTTIATINASTGALTCVKPGSVTVYAEAEGYNKASATIEISKSWLESIAVSGSMTKTSYTTLEQWSPAGLTVTGTYHSGWEEEISSGIAWTYEPATPAAGVTSVVATATVDEKTGSSSAQAVTVTEMHAGTFADPYTVANARSAIDAGSGITGVYAIGIVSEIVTDYSTEYKNISFNISTDGLTTSNQLQAYRCVSSTAHTISSNDDVEIGATVIVKGNLKNFHGTYEFDAGCTIESYTAPEKGDIEVTFNPATNYEVGASATFAATTNPTGATLAWESNNPSVLSVNASTGAFQALSVGVARVTVTATLGDQHGTAFADIVVNGSQTSPFSVSDVFDEITPSLDGTTAYYIYVSAYVKEFATSMSSANPPKPRAIDVVDFDEESRIMVYTNVDPYEGFIDGLSLGDQILVKAKVQKFVSGNTITYQLTQPEKISSHTSAMAFAFKLLEETDGKCSTYEDGKSSYSEFKTYFEGVWGDVKAAYDALEAIEGEQDKVLAAEGNENGTVLEQAMARYDLLVAKYGLTHFVTSRAKISYRGFADLSIMNADSNMIIIIAVTSASVLAFAMLLVFKKKKQK